jgi:hypothetical protein
MMGMVGWVGLVHRGDDYTRTPGLMRRIEWLPGSGLTRQKSR